MSKTQDRIQQLVSEHKVVLFMKGTRMFPQCGFSARAVEIFKRCGVTFEGVNVLADPELREGIKEFSSWPTIPQAYIDGEFVGGSDILLEMYESGELQKLLGVADGSDEVAAAPTLTVSERAKAAIAEAHPGDGEVLRFEVSPAFVHDLSFGPQTEGDHAVDVGGLVIFVPPRSASRANGVSIDYVEGPEGAGFKIDNPNQPA